VSRFFLIVFFIFLGCSVKQEKRPSLPNWYLNPPKSSEYVYETGSGNSKKEAVLNALSNFVASLNVKISSEFSLKKEAFSGALYSKSTQYKLKAEVSKIEISNYEVVKVYPYFDKILVLVKIDKKKLFENLKTKLDMRFKEYKKRFEKIRQKNSLSQFIELKKLEKSLKDEIVYLNFLKSLNPSFNQKPYFNFIEEVNNYLNGLKVSVKIVSASFEAKEDIKRYLSSKGVYVDKNSNLILEVKVLSKENKSIMDLMVYNIYITLKEKDKLISTNSFKIILPKTTTLSGNLYDEIKDLSLEKFFNLKE